MAVKLVLLKSGEGLISDVQEMVIGDEENPKVVGYFLKRPCLAKIANPEQIEEGDDKKVDMKKFKVKLYPWIPLTYDEVIPVPSDWVVTIVNPFDQLENMYKEQVLNYGSENQTNSIGEQSEANFTD